jgi:hypothetical protein
MQWDVSTFYFAQQQEEPWQCLHGNQNRGSNILISFQTEFFSCIISTSACLYCNILVSLSTFQPLSSRLKNVVVFSLQLYNAYNHAFKINAKEGI